MSANKAVQIRGLLYEFEAAQDGKITHIKVTTPLTSKDEWPRFTASVPGGRIDTLEKNDMRIPFVRTDLRSLETALAIFDAPTIDTDQFVMNWIAENPEEQAELQVTEFTQSVETDQTARSVGFDVAIRSIIAAFELQKIELPLSFFRQGSIAYRERRYIEAIYQFYLLIETLFGNGKTGNKAIKKEFKKSTLLRSAVEDFLKTLGDPNPSPKLAQELTDKFTNFNVDSLIDHIVEMRGFFHHHTSKRRDVWHPSMQEAYSLVSLMFAQIAMKIATRLVFQHIGEQKVIDEYLKLVQARSTLPDEESH